MSNFKYKTRMFRFRHKNLVTACPIMAFAAMLFVPVLLIAIFK